MRTAFFVHVPALDVVTIQSSGSTVNASRRLATGTPGSRRIDDGIWRSLAGESQLAPAPGEARAVAVRPRPRRPQPAPQRGRLVGLEGT